ncbi:uncharacterized protein BXZ73DRAFT_97136 [Epithele typhae]|uniref:uncharacterized protein n=1 Tax=Epithele typhae TaxID=378194 RepID=UPI002007B38C|nr:uncharacterized protein BXZ73DRAFT_97136 [Epithele typhae]KAH9943074.1 hypothetical protein BXZ73DRAFT_97136 [Epithele typhae]
MSYDTLLARTLKLNPRQRRTALSSLFGLTALAALATVSASALLPCPVPRSRFADDGGGGAPAGGHRVTTVVDRKPRRWIEETRPPSQSQS